MSRIGIRPDEEVMKLVSEALDMPGIEIEWIFTHFARADEKDKTSARRQLSLFNDFVEKIRQERGLRIPICHCAMRSGQGLPCTDCGLRRRYRGISWG